MRQREAERDSERQKGTEKSRSRQREAETDRERQNDKERGRDLASAASGASVGRRLMRAETSRGSLVTRCIGNMRKLCRDRLWHI